MQVRRIVAVLVLLVCICGRLAASEGTAESEAAPSVFEGYFGESIWTLVWFGVLLGVLWKFAWKPLLAGLTGRQEYIERQISDAEKTRAEAKKVLEEYGAKLADAERQGRDIIAARIRDAEKQAQEVQLKIQQEIEQRKARAEADLDRERIEAEEKLWVQAGEIIRRLGQDVFGKALDDEDNQRLIRQAIDRLKEVSRR
ncbi:MAG TPA: ATP synthase F0 subunit B [Anaerohalosphaeraceae bacterium]|nr:ATP synthase F0 subunit B [Phycisphaerae bacterium]HOK95573.1 ATP synthase F0 subunit B [Anaerohalosphaeraceae bacterium]HOL30661.1 ATP synthase F0 subunit B [Anaerohalosphaeraceae bacterium]HOM76986.1 ATP synthase F0 subunit B [Anaerohalosphaeraceae bacterium]HPO70546.1 ATP synthase F0 subunit B [Anaerohalosphaeraceae bacterium]